MDAQRWWLECASERSKALGECVALREKVAQLERRNAAAHDTAKTSACAWCGKQTVFFMKVGDYEQHLCIGCGLSHYRKPKTGAEPAVSPREAEMASANARAAASRKTVVMNDYVARDLTGNGLDLKGSCTVTLSPDSCYAQALAESHPHCRIWTAVHDPVEAA